MNKKSHSVLYRVNDNCYYKINSDLKRITKIENNIVSYLDYDTHSKEIFSYKKTKVNNWKHVENSFFISRDFEWEYQGHKYRTTNKPLVWGKDKHTHQTFSFVFHNGRIWKAYNSSNYYPRIYLSKEDFVNPTRQVLFEKDLSQKIDIKVASITIKWTDIKYCRHFEQIS